jgi:hypothetical protein
MLDTPTIDVAIPVEARFAEKLSDPETRAEAGRLVSEMLRKAAIERLIAAMDAFGAEAERNGLTEEIINEELAAHKAERRARRDTQRG